MKKRRTYVCCGCQREFITAQACHAHEQTCIYIVRKEGR